jgi:hypothetical protein
MEKSEITVLSVDQVKGQIKLFAKIFVISLCIFIISFFLVLNGLDAGGIVFFAFGVSYWAFYDTLECMWILRGIRRSSNVFTLSQVHLRLGIKILYYSCLAFIWTILYLFAFIDECKRELGYEEVIVLVMAGIFLIGLTCFLINTALQKFRAAGRYEEKERIEREQEEANFTGE